MRFFGLVWFGLVPFVLFCAVLLYLVSFVITHGCISLHEYVGQKCQCGYRCNLGPASHGLYRQRYAWSQLRLGSARLGDGACS